MKRQSDKKVTKQIRIDVGWHEYLKVHAAIQGKTIKGVVEECLADYYDPKLYGEMVDKKRENKGNQTKSTKFIKSRGGVADGREK